MGKISTFFRISSAYEQANVAEHKKFFYNRKPRVFQVMHSISLGRLRAIPIHKKFPLQPACRERANYCFFEYFERKKIKKILRRYLTWYRYGYILYYAMMKKGGFTMKVKVTNLKDFRSALSFAALASEASKALEIAGCVLLEAKDNKLTMTFTDLSMRVQAEIPAEIAEEGAIAVNAKNLASFIKNAKSTMVIEAYEDKVKLCSEKAEIVLKAFNAEDFPLGTEAEADIVYTITIQANILKQALEKLLFIPLPNDWKPIESSIYMHISNGELRFCATDKFRLGIVSLTKQCDIENVSALLPERAARALYKIVDVVPVDDVTILLSAKRIATRTVTVSKISAVSFFAGSFTLFSPSLDYEYPEYQKILAGKIVGTARVNRKHFVDVLRPLAKMKGTGIIKLSYDQSLIVAYEENGMKAISRIPCRTNGSVPQVSVNARFLFEPMSIIKDEEVTMKFSGALTPIIIEAKDYMYVVAPFRLP